MLLLDNSFGPWHEMYQQGIHKTWRSPNFERHSKVEYETLGYMGSRPRFQFLTPYLNRALVSRLFLPHWNHSTFSFGEARIDVEVSGTSLRIQVPDLWPYISAKTYTALEYVLESFDFDFILRVNTTCYVNLDLLENFLKGQENRIVYAGPIEKGKDFVSGWCIVLSKKALQIMVSEPKNLIKGLFDDEFIGRTLFESNVNPVAIPFKRFISLSEVTSMSKIHFEKYPLFRVKATLNGRRIDDVLMQALHQRLLQSAKE